MSPVGKNMIGMYYLCFKVDVYGHGLAVAIPILEGMRYMLLPH